MKKNDFLLSAPRAVRLMLMVLMCLPMWGGSVLMAQTSEPYAVFDEASGVLTFKYDNKKPGGAYSLNYQESTTPWKDVKGKIKRLYSTLLLQMQDLQNVPAGSPLVLI